VKLTFQYQNLLEDMLSEKTLYSYEAKIFKNVCITIIRPGCLRLNDFNTFLIVRAKVFQVYILSLRELYIDYK
jgi:hypothetical protein